MPNPPASAPANSFIIKGLTTIRWGTDGWLQDAALQNGAAIVRNIKQSRRVDEDKEENNAGFEVAVILIIQGQNYDITVTDDSTKSWPVTGSKLLVQGADDAQAITFLVVDDNYNVERKKSGERVIRAKCFNAFAIS